jgi:3-oxoacyl-[acyl-carrier-protein] synthase II
MKTDIYIRSASCISPQQTFGAGLPSQAITFSGRRLAAIEPDYKIHLNIPAARRMSRLIKMGVSAALSCLQDAAVKIPDAVIVGTGLGCMEDSEKFLASLITNHEQTLSPTSFIFSTHNTVAAQIALLLHCNNYNFTHTHRGLSFENSLLDSILFINDHSDAGVLVGAADEVTSTSFKILERLGVIRKEESQSDTKAQSGTMAGEGAAFFFLNGMKDENNLAKISEVSVFSNPGSENEIHDWVRTSIERHGLSSADFILTGMNGNEKSDQIYHAVLKEHFKDNHSGTFKNLCGDYHTATAFACWLSAVVLKSQQLPGYLIANHGVNESIKRIVIFNHYKGREFSLIILERC